MLPAVVTSRLLGDTVQEEHLFPDALSYYYSRTVVQLYLDTSVGPGISLLLTTGFVQIGTSLLLMPLWYIIFYHSTIPCL